MGITGRQARFKIFNAALVSGSGATTGIAISSAIEISYAAGKFAFAGAASTSAADINIFYDMSDDNSNWDTSRGSTEKIKDAQSSTYLVSPFETPVAKYIRLVAIGDGSNPGSTTISGRLIFTEE